MNFVCLEGTILKIKDNSFLLSSDSMKFTVYIGSDRKLDNSYAGTRVNVTGRLSIKSVKSIHGKSSKKFVSIDASKGSVIVNNKNVLSGKEQYIMEDIIGMI